MILLMETLDILLTKSNNLGISSKLWNTKLFLLQVLGLQIKQQKSSFKMLEMSQYKATIGKNNNNMSKKFK